MQKFSLLVALIVLSLNLAAQSYSIKGTVQSERGEPLSGATVAIHETQASSVADKNGQYEIDNVKPGFYHLHIRMLGYEAQAKNIKVANADVEMNFSLKQSHLEIKEVVIEGSSKTLEEQQSLSVEVADEDFLSKNTDANLMRSLQKMPGIDMISVSTAVSKPVIRGLGFNRVLVAQNGIKQEGQQWGADHGLEIDAFQVGQVEIVKGPSSVLWGSDAMGGVLNIKPPAPPLKNSLRSEIVLLGHTNADMLAGSAMIEGNTNGLFFRTRYSKKDYADYKVPAKEFEYNDYIFPIYNNRLKNTAGNEESFSGSVGINKNWGVSQLTVSNFAQQVGFFPGAHGRPTAESVVDDGNNRNIDFPYQEINHFKVVSNSNIKVKNHWLEVDLGYQENARAEKNFFHSHGNGPVIEGTDALKLNLQTSSANVRFHHRLSGRVNSIYGMSGQYKNNQQGGFEFLLSDFYSYNAGAFTTQEYTVSDEMTLNAGLRYDQGFMAISQFIEPVYNSADEIIDYYERVPEITRDYSSLSGGVGMSWLPTHHFNLKLNVGSSFRYPNAVELSSNGVHHGAFRYEQGNSNLQPERGYQFDLGIAYHKEEYLFKINPFVNYFTNYIFLNPSGKFAPLGTGGGQLYAYEQATALNTGAEVSVDYHLMEQLHLGVGGSYIWNYNIDEGYPLPFTPPAKLLTEVEYEFGEFKRFHHTFVSLNTNLVAPQNWTARNELETPGYVVLNTAIGTKLQLGKNRPLEMVFRVQNIANQKYFNHLSFYRQLNLPEPGRNFLLSIKVPLFTMKKENV